MANSTVYWASKDIEEIADEVVARFDSYRQWMNTTGYANRIRRCWETFYGFNSDGTLRVTRDENETAHINTNHYKSLLKRLHILVTEAKLAFQPRAKSSDTKSEIESNLAKAVVEYYGDEKNLNGLLSDAVLGALIMLEQWIHAPWDISAGYELTADGGQIIRSGDQAFETYSAFDVARNTAGKEASDWYIIRSVANKWDLAALHPQFADEILAESMPEDINGLLCHLGSRNHMASQMSEDTEDRVHVYTLYHARTPAMPNGRRTVVCASQVLDDGPLRYTKMPVFRLSAGDVLQTPFGDSPAIDLLPLQEALNALASATLTNNLNNAQQLIYSADPNLTTRKLSDGQTLVSAASPPSALNLTGSAGENLKYMDILKSDQQLLSGVNDTARGNPSTNLKSGSSLALVLAQAIQFASALQKSYAKVAGDVASCLVSNIQLFATEEMTAYVVGSSKKGQVKKFKAKDLMNVERITVDLGNPLTQTLAGRSDMMQQWMQYGVVKDPKQIVAFLATGNLDQSIDDEFSDAMLIADENEMIKRGDKPTPFLLDQHVEHINSHKQIASSPEARADPALMALATAHIQEHIALMRQVPPDLAAVLSGQPLPPPPQAGQPPAPEQPDVAGARMPSLPPDAPATSQENYQQALQAVPAPSGT